VGENATDLVIRLLDGKSIVLVGMDNYDALRSGGPIAVANDEKSYSDPRGFVEVIDPAIADKRAPTLDVSTPRGRNHFYHDWMTGWGEGRDPDTRSWKIRTEDVGTVHMDELRKFKKGGTKQMTPEFYAQEWEGEFLGYEGLVFPEFINRPWPAGHILNSGVWNSMKRSCYHFGSCDWGFSDETVMHWLARTTEGRVVAYGEIAEKNKTPAQIATVAKARYGFPQTVHLDPSAWDKESDGKSVAEKFIAVGMRCIRADNRFQASIEHLRTMMTMTKPDVMPNFMIVEGTCPHLVENLSRLEDTAINPAGGGFRRHVDCHAADSIRYGAMSVYVGTPREEEHEEVRGPAWIPWWEPGQDEPRFDPISGLPEDD